MVCNVGSETLVKNRRISLNEYEQTAGRAGLFSCLQLRSDSRLSEFLAQ